MSVDSAQLERTGSGKAATQVLSVRIRIKTLACSSNWHNDVMASLFESRTAYVVTQSLSGRPSRNVAQH